VDDLIEDEDHICFALDPRINWVEQTTSKRRREVGNMLLSYIRANWGMNESDRKAIMLDFHEFTNRTGRFRNNPIFFPDYDSGIDPLTYWESFDDSLLSPIACALFRMVTSSASVERCFSKQKLIHSHLRNRMKQKTVEKIVAVSCSDTNGSQMNLRKQKLIKMSKGNDDADMDISDEEELDEKADKVVAADDNDLQHEAHQLTVDTDEESDAEEDIIDPELDLTAVGDAVLESDNERPENEEEDDVYAFKED
jgi:hypothetical protein